jgi:hypothetical protein
MWREPGRVIAHDIDEAMAIAKDSWGDWCDIQDVREVTVDNMKGLVDEAWLGF